MRGFLKSNPVTELSNVMMIRNYIEHKEFPYKIAYDHCAKSVLFYIPNEDEEFASKNLEVKLYKSSKFGR